MKAVIFTEGGINIGLGHISRCVALRDAFVSNGVSVKLIIDADNSADFLIPKGSIRHRWLNDYKLLRKVAVSSDIVIIDSYKAPLVVYRLASKLCGVAAYIDDYNRLIYPPGIVINGSMNAQRIRYPKRRKVKYLLGVKYAYLRKEFALSSKVVKVRKSISRLLIILGGIDYGRLAPSILRYLQDKFPGLNKTVIIGRRSASKERLEKIASSNTCLVYNASASRLKEVMFGSDLAVSAGGQTLYELGKVGLPAVVIEVARNQRQNIVGWSESGFIEFAGRASSPDLLQKLSDSIEKVMSFRKRLRMQRSAKNRMRGNSTYLLVKTLINYAKKQKNL